MQAARPFLAHSTAVPARQSPHDGKPRKHRDTNRNGVCLYGTLRYRRHLVPKRVPRPCFFLSFIAFSFLVWNFLGFSFLPLPLLPLHSADASRLVLSCLVLPCPFASLLCLVLSGLLVDCLVLSGIRSLVSCPALSCGFSFLCFFFCLFFACQYFFYWYDGFRFFLRFLIFSPRRIRRATFWESGGACRT